MVDVHRSLPRRARRRRSPKRCPFLTTMCGNALSRLLRSATGPSGRKRSGGLFLLGVRSFCSCCGLRGYAPSRRWNDARISGSCSSRIVAERWLQSLVDGQGEAAVRALDARQLAAGTVLPDLGLAAQARLGATAAKSVEEAGVAVRQRLEPLEPSTRRASSTAASGSIRSANSIHRRRPAFGAGPISSMRSVGSNASRRSGATARSCRPTAPP